MSSASQIGSFNVGSDDGSQSRVWMITWNYDGSLLASCGEDKAVRIWKHNADSPLLECRSVLDDSHTRAVRSVAFSHCGRYLASASFDSSVVIYQKEDGDFSEVNKLEGHESEVKWCAFSPSDEFLATCSRDKSVWFWQMDEDDDFQVSSILQPHTQDVKFVVWHPNAELLVSCSYDYSIRFFRYDGDDWVTQHKIEKAHEGTVWCADFDGSGDRLVTVGEDRVVQLWQREFAAESVTSDTWRAVCRHTVEDTRWALYSVSWNKTTGLIAVGGGDSTIRLFRIDGVNESATIVPEQIIRIHTGEVNCVAWCPSDASLLASCGDDGTIRLTKVAL